VVKPWAYADLALALSEVTGRPVKYQSISTDEARSRMRAKGVSPETIDAVLAIAEYQKAGGRTATISDKVERILGRPPRNIRDFVRYYAGYFTTAVPSNDAGQPTGSVGDTATR
jgi:NAD(P)H dehydrogenase (quinone)